MSGLLEIFAALGGREDLPNAGPRPDLRGRRPAAPRRRSADARAGGGGRRRSPRSPKSGKVFVAADILESKQIFAAAAKERAHLYAAICAALATTKDGTLGEGFFLDLLRRGFSEEEARQQMRIAIDWGRYGELFDFDANTGSSVGGKSDQSRCQLTVRSRVVTGRRSTRLLWRGGAGSRPRWRCRRPSRSSRPSNPALPP